MCMDNSKLVIVGVNSQSNAILSVYDMATYSLISEQ